MRRSWVRFPVGAIWGNELFSIGSSLGVLRSGLRYSSAYSTGSSIVCDQVIDVIVLHIIIKLLCFLTMFANNNIKFIIYKKKVY